MPSAGHARRCAAANALCRMAVTEHLEIERKYDVGEEAEVPDLSGLPGVSSVSGPEEHELAADYFDTPDLRLATAGVTLRRRTGGDDEGWHLKLPADGGRREIRVPLGQAVKTPPVSLRRLVVAYTRREPLALVVSLQTWRSARRLLADDGGVLAEVCDDRVTADLPGWDAEPPVWREWEAELASGERDLLDDVDVLLAGAGALPSTHGSKLLRVLGARVAVPPGAPSASAGGPAVDVVLAYLHEQRAALLRLDPALRSEEAEAVHDTRVALRRLRSVLATYRRLFDREAVAHLRGESSWLAGSLGTARDAEVLRDHLRAALAAEPADLVLGSVATRLDDELSTAFQRGHDDAQAVLDAERYLDLLDEIDGFLDRPPVTELARRPAQSVVPMLVQRDWRRLHNAIGRAESLPVGSVGRDEALHEVRKAAKRLRYAAESATPAFGKQARRLARSAKQLQTVLGDHHDTVVARDLLRRVGVDAHLAGDNAFTYGRLHGLFQARAEHLERRWHKAWTRLARSRPSRWG
jgi:CHAD domain-containing protein